jgi:FixJ family two-component response regulator
MHVAAREARPTVYIVDADASVRRSLARLMRSEGYTVRAFASAEAFLTQRVPATPACVVLDLGPSGPTGHEMERRLNERGERLPIIAASARDDNEIREEARRLGARAFFRKPVDGRTLIDAIDWVLEPATDDPTH